MTSVRFKVIDGLITSFEISGHAEYSDGDDIVCASISSCAYMVANTITEIYAVNAEISVDEENGSFYLSISKEDAEKCKELLKGLQLHLNSLAQDFPRNIRCSTQTIS